LSGFIEHPGGFAVTRTAKTGLSDTMNHKGSLQVQVSLYRNKKKQTLRRAGWGFFPAPASKCFYMSIKIREAYICRLYRVIPLGAKLRTTAPEKIPARTATTRQTKCGQQQGSGRHMRRPLHERYIMIILFLSLFLRFRPPCQKLPSCPSA
jgi:hypothetical protein